MTEAAHSKENRPPQTTLLEQILDPANVRSAWDLKSFFDPLDREMESMGLPFVRYADDFLIMTKTRAEALAVMAKVTELLEARLKLASRSRKGLWRLARNSLVCLALNDQYLKDQGVPSLRDLWVVFKYGDKAKI